MTGALHWYCEHRVGRKGRVDVCVFLMDYLLGALWQKLVVGLC